MFVAILLFLLLLTAAFSFVVDERPMVRWVVFTVIVLVLTLMAGLRPIGIDKDSWQYYGYYLGQYDDIVELSFIHIRELVKATMGDVRGVFLLYALIAIPLKCYVFTKLSTEHFLLLGVYMSNFLVLHDMTQIRVGAAMAFIFLGFYFFTQGRRWPFFCLILVATYFHVSAILLMLVLLFRNNDLKPWHRIVLALTPFLALTSAFFDINLSTLIPISFVQEKMELYEGLKEKGAVDVEKINIFNAAIMLKLAVFYFLLWKYDVVKKQCAYLTLLLKIFALSYVCLGMLNFIAVFAARVSELFLFVEILMVPLIIYAIRPQWVGRLFISIYIIGIFLLNVVYAGLLSF